MSRTFSAFLKFNTTIVLILHACVITDLYAQCSCTDCPVTLPHVGTNAAHLTVSGAAVNDLDGVNQFVRVVQINVVHDALRECEIRLIAPNGSSVLLSDNVGINFGNNITYRICFLNCTETATPDPGFPENFNAAAGYMNNQTYYGSYYPFDGSCLSTLTGPVNGTWTLDFIDFVGGDGGQVIDWSIEFWDNTGTGCFVDCSFPPAICTAVEDTLVIPPVGSFCLGSPDLQFSITSVYIPPLPDPSDFGYIFILTDRTTMSTIAYNTDQNFTNLPPGEYQLCGVTYLLTDAHLLPPIDGTDLYFVIKDMISQGILCASLSKDCFVFTVVDDPLPLGLAGPTLVQSGDPSTYTILNFELGVLTTVYIQGGCYTGFNVVDDKIHVTWLSGPGEICVFKTNACYNETVCLDVEVISDAVQITISGPSEICGGETAEYTISPVINTQEFNYTWNVSNGTIQSQSNSGITVEWDETGTGEICLTVTDVCGQVYTFCYAVNITQVLAGPPAMNDFPAIVCLNTILEANLTVSPGYQQLIWSVAGGSVIAGQGSEDVLFTAGMAGIVSICADVYYECEIHYQICKDVEYVERPNPSLQWLQSCGLFGELRIANPGSTSSFYWEQISGPGTITFQQTNSTGTMFSGDIPGVYVILVTETIGDCSGARSLSFELKPDMITEDLEVDCSDINGYTVSFTISGGTPPYFVDAVPLTGNVFTSPLLPHGQDYTFLLQDNSNCLIYVTGRSKCDCFTDAGNSGEQTLIVCEGETAIGQTVTDAVLDPDDIGLYILHSSPTNTPGVIYQYNTLPEFGFQPPLVYGQTYYISYIVGNEFNGNVDFLDPCLSVSRGQPVIFSESPKPDLLVPPPVCGLSTEVTILTVPGVRYTITPVNPDVSVEMITPEHYRINASVYGTQILTLSAEKDGCTGEKEFYVVFSQPPSAMTRDFVCSSDLSTYDVTISMEGNAPFTISGAQVNQQSEFVVILENLVSSANTTITIMDDIGCTVTLSVTYDCLCQSSPGTMSPALLRACENDGVQAVYMHNGNPGNVDSFIYILHTLSGNVLGDILATSSDGYFEKNPAFQYNTVYYISYVTVTFVNGQYQWDPCSFVAPGQPVIFIENPEVSWEIIPENCATNAAFQIHSSATIQILQLTSGPAGSSISMLNNSGFSADSPGLYIFSLEADNQGCTLTFSGEVTLYDAPEISLVNTSCSGLLFETEFEVTKGTPPYLLNGITIITSPQTGPLIPSGELYSFYVVDSRGCQTMEVTATKECNCVTDVGILNGNGFILCPEQDFSPEFVQNFVLDAGYDIRYILHDGNSTNIGTIYWEGTQFPIPYQPAFEGKELVITRILGMILPDGSLDLSDACAGVSNSLPVRWNQKPQISVVALPFYCEGNDITVQVNNIPEGNLNLSYQNGQSVPIQQGITDITLNPDNIRDGEFILFTFTDPDGCIFILDNLQILIRPIPYAGQTAGSFGNCVYESTRIRLDDYIIDENSGGQWFLDNFTNPVSNEITIGPGIELSALAYYLVTNECGMDTSTVLIERWPAPDFELEGSDPLCPGQSNGGLHILPQSASNDWQFFVNNIRIHQLELNDLPAGLYSIQAVNAFNCSSTLTITLEDPDPLQLDLGSDITIDEGDTIAITALLNIPADKIQSSTWSFPWGEVRTGTQLTVIVNPVKEGFVQLIITDINGCTITDEIFLRIKEKIEDIVITIPNIILTGSSNNGRFFLPDPRFVQNIVYCKIYDRWGNLVYNAENIPPDQMNWDGRFRDKNVVQGVYVYTMNLLLTDGSFRLLSGDITVLE